MKKSDADFDYTPAEMPSAGIFVPADEPLLVFPSIRAAERYLEVTDIKAGRALKAKASLKDCSMA
jgi:hypothetical protein